MPSPLTRVLLLPLRLALPSCQLVAPTAISSAAAVVTAGAGWAQSGGIQHLPVGPCHIRTSADGHDLPDPRCTPGAVDDRVNSQPVTATICRKGGYTTSVRPPESVSGPAKRAIMLAYGLNPSDAGDYELDHLVELSLGGSSDGRNLWPERNVLRDAKPDPYTKNDKDAVEHPLTTRSAPARSRCSKPSRRWPATGPPCAPSCTSDPRRFTCRGTGGAGEH